MRVYHNVADLIEDVVFAQHVDDARSHDGEPRSKQERKEQAVSDERDDCRHV